MRPYDYTPVIYTIAGVVLTILTLRYAIKPIKRIMGKQDMWLLFIMVFLLLTQAFTIIMCSGFMWCNIRNPQFAGRDKNGNVGYIAAGFSDQYGAEIYIISALCMFEITKIQSSQCVSLLWRSISRASSLQMTSSLRCMALLVFSLWRFRFLLPFSDRRIRDIPSSWYIWFKSSCSRFSEYTLMEFIYSFYVLMVFYAVGVFFDYLLSWWT